MYNGHQHVRELIAWVQEAFPAIYSLDLAFSGCTIRLYANSPPLLQALREHYRPIVTTRATPDCMMTILQTPPFIIDSAADVRLVDDYELIIRRAVVEELAGQILHDRANGMLSMLDDAHYLIMGPAMERRDAVIRFIHEACRMQAARRVSAATA